MDVVIVNTSKLRVALNCCAKSKNYKSTTALLTTHSMSSSVIKKAEDRFSTRYISRVSFTPDTFTAYGAIYEDIWRQLCDVADINKDDFELERVVGDKGGGNLKGLENRVTELECAVSSLKAVVDKLKKELGVE